MVYAPPCTSPETEAALLRQAREGLEELVRAAAPPSARVNVVVVQEEGRAGRTLCAVAEELRADPLVLAAHSGRGGPLQRLGSWLHGGDSVTSFCAQHCTRPVLLLHADVM